MSDSTEQTAEQAAAFQKIWMESMSKLMQTAFTFTPDSPPPEVLRQIRTGIFQALAESWQEFMRSPQFLEGMKQWMEGAVAFRRTTNDFMAKVRNEMQAPSREDIDSIMLSVRHMETRLLDRLEQLAGQVSELNRKLAERQSETPTKPTVKAEPGHASKAPKKRSAPGS
ncbi:MAG TPA: hypothetical protein VFE51_09105 [Verrucomicrobiae bacterium]|nr:hypothetical protein [Verrucomicrobiae bacterium]